MAASAVLTLDVTPPVVTLGEAVLLDGDLIVTYGITEPALTGVSLEGLNRPVTVEPGRILVPDAPTTGALLLTARDSVGNQATVRAEYTVSFSARRLRLAIRAVVAFFSRLLRRRPSSAAQATSPRVAVNTVAVGASTGASPAGHVRITVTHPPS